MSSKHSQEFYARFYLTDDHQVQWQLVQDHLREVAQLAYDGLKEVDDQLAVWAKLAGLFHDYGKYQDAFQERLQQASAKELAYATAASDEQRNQAKKLKVQTAPHAALGVDGYSAYLLGLKQSSSFFSLLAYPILGHHAGLADELKRNAQIDQGVYERFMHEMQGDLAEVAPQLADCFVESSKRYEQLDLQTQVAQQGFDALMALRLVFSSLVHADHYTSAQFKRAVQVEPFATIQELKTNFQQEYQRFMQEKSQEAFSANMQKLQEIRASVYQQCLQAAQDAPGIFSLTVPTGGGKTLSSLAFALEHASVHHHQRIIYVAPFTSILDQTIGIYQRYLQERNVFAHYSTYDHESSRAKSGASEDYDPLIAALSESWSQPVIVTTAVQFWESLFSHQPARSKKVHHIANSVIILDEIQSLPRKYLIPILYMMRSLVRYGCSVVLCSATQPQFNSDKLKKYALSDIQEIIDNPQALANSLARVNIEIATQAISLQELSQQVLSHPQALVIVNKRKTAQLLAEHLAQSGGAVFHLSGLMCVAHRQAILKRVREEYLAEDLACYVVSTQLIEAGVDIDFPVVYREEAGLENLVQSAGRCNREFKLERGQFVIFALAQEKPSTIYKDVLPAYHNIRDQYQTELFSLEAIEAYYHEIYHYDNTRVGNQGISPLDNTGIEALVERTGQQLQRRAVWQVAALQRIGRGFRLIDNEQYSIVVPYDDVVKKLIETLKDKGISAKLLRQLAPYTVGVYVDHFNELKNRGHLVEFISDKQKKQGLGLYYLSEATPGLYDMQLGLACDTPESIDPIF